MAPMSTTPPQRSAYGIEFSDRRCFTSPKDIQNALEDLARYLTKDNFGRVLEPLLLEQALGIELILSGMYFLAMYSMMYFMISS